MPNAVLPSLTAADASLAASVLAFAFAVVLQRRLLRNATHHPVSYSIAIQLTAGLLLLIPAAVAGQLIPFHLALLPNLALTVVLYSLSSMAAYHALRHTTTARFTVIGASRSLWTSSAGVLILGEPFGMTRAIGALLVLAGVVIVAAPYHHTQNTAQVRKGDVLAAVTALAFGLALVNDAFLLQRIPLFAYLSLAFLGPAAVLFITHTTARRDLPALLRTTDAPHLLLIGGLMGSSAVLLFLSYTSGRTISSIAVISETSTLVAICLAAVLLGEKAHLLRNVGGSILCAIGIGLVR